MYQYYPLALISNDNWKGKPLFTNNGLPLQCFPQSEPSDAETLLQLMMNTVHYCKLFLSFFFFFFSYWR